MTTSPRVFCIALACALSFVALRFAGAQLPLFLPGTEYRSLNTETYEIAIQRNGRVDVILVSGEPAMTNAFPMVWIDGKGAPETLPVDGRFSEREAVNDPLGRGQGVMLLKDECEWNIRAYPTQPFFAVQVGYRNTSRKPVRIRALYPWVIGPPKRGQVNIGVGTGDSPILEPRADGITTLTRGHAVGAGHLAAYNPGAGRSLVVGFLTAEGANTMVSLDREPNGELFNSLRAQSIYDPPVELLPGEQLRSGVVYFGIAETNPFDALERYAAAVAATSGLASEYDGTPIYGGSIPDDFTFSAAQIAPIDTWNSPMRPEKMGVVEALRTAARRYYFAPRLADVSAGPIAVRALALEQNRAALTAAALLGGPLVIAERAEEVAPEIQSIIDKLTPPSPHPARPIDLFDGAPPRLWRLRLEAAGEEWHFAAVFNWHATEPQRLDIPFSALGLDPATPYAVYDFWRGAYHGLARDTLFVDAAPASVRLLSFRRFRDRPMLLAMDHHFLQGARELTAHEWDPARMILRGSFDAEAQKSYRMIFLVPSAFRWRGVHASADGVQTEIQGDTLIVELTARDQGPVDWTTLFARS